MINDIFNHSENFVWVSALDLSANSFFADPVTRGRQFTDYAISCNDSASKIAENNILFIRWVKGHSDILGNLQGQCYGLELLFPMPLKFIKCFLADYMLERHKWKSLEGCSLSRNMIVAPSPELKKKYCMQLSHSMLIGIL